MLASLSVSQILFSERWRWPCWKVASLRLKTLLQNFSFDIHKKYPRKEVYLSLNIIIICQVNTEQNKQTFLNKQFYWRIICIKSFHLLYHRVWWDLKSVIITYRTFPSTEKVVSVWEPFPCFLFISFYHLFSLIWLSCVTVWFCLYLFSFSALFECDSFSNLKYFDRSFFKYSSPSDSSFLHII